MKIWEDLLQDIKKNIPSGTECELKMMHSKSALTRFANSQIHQNVDEESADVFLTLHNDSKTITISTNLTALKNPKDFVSRALDSLNDSPLDKGWAGLPDSSESFNGLSNIDESTPDERANTGEFLSARERRSQDESIPLCCARVSAPEPGAPKEREPLHPPQANKKASNKKLDSQISYFSKGLKGLITKSNKNLLLKDKKSRLSLQKSSFLLDGRGCSFILGVPGLSPRCSWYC
mgnify:CR=1 FL=1